MQRGRDGNRAGVAMLAATSADYFDARFDVGAVRETTTRKINLINIQRTPLDQRAKRFAPAFRLARGDRYGRTILQPGVAINVIRPQRFLQPADVELGERL